MKYFLVEVPAAVVAQMPGNQAAVEALLNQQGEYLTIPSEVAANAAAAALNEATTETVNQFSSQTAIYSNSLCPTYQEYFETEFNDLFDAILITEVSDFYGIDFLSWEYGFDTEPSAQVGYSGAYVPETSRVADWSMVIGIGRDDCADSIDP